MTSLYTCLSFVIFFTSMVTVPRDQPRSLKAARSAPERPISARLSVRQNPREGGQMPEGPEVETENLREAIQEEMEKEGGSFLKQIALTTALLAVAAAIASLRAGATVNEALVLKTEATRLQAEASDQWAYYQAKGLKAAVQEASATAWLARGRGGP